MKRLIPRKEHNVNALEVLYTLSNNYLIGQMLKNQTTFVANR